MTVRINCKYNDGMAWCKCSKVKRKLWGMGARMCVEFENTGGHTVKCQFKEEFPKPPPPPPKRIIREDVKITDKVRMLFDEIGS